MPTIRCALYARVSTTDQHTENQVTELRQYCGTRGWMITREYVDHGVRGAKERRPALDELVRDAKRRRFDVLVCWRLDRLGRNLRHLVLLLEGLHALGISFASLNEGIDATTPAGRLQMHMLAALSEFERGRIQERVRAGLARARAKGRRLGRPTHRLSDADLARTQHLGVRAAARVLHVSPALISKLRSQNPPDFRHRDNTQTVSDPVIDSAVHQWVDL
jgi:DNA invertase Pin-like site-specific DNA recombinase